MVLITKEEKAKVLAKMTEAKADFRDETCSCSEIRDRLLTMVDDLYCMEFKDECDDEGDDDD